MKTIHTHTHFLCLYLLAGAPTHMPVWSNGAHGGKGIVHYRKDNSFQACVLWRAGEEEPRWCLISLHNRQYEHPAGSWTEASGLGVWWLWRAEACSVWFTWFCSTSFEISSAARWDNCFCRSKVCRVTTEEKVPKLWGSKAKHLMVPGCFYARRSCW